VLNIGGAGTCTKLDGASECFHDAIADVSSISGLTSTVNGLVSTVNDLSQFVHKTNCAPKMTGMMQHGYSDTEGARTLSDGFCKFTCAAGYHDTEDSGSCHACTSSGDCPPGQQFTAGDCSTLQNTAACSACDTAKPANSGWTAGCSFACTGGWEGANCDVAPANANGPCKLDGLSHKTFEWYMPSNGDMYDTETHYKGFNFAGGGDYMTYQSPCGAQAFGGLQWYYSWCGGRRGASVYIDGSDHNGGWTNIGYGTTDASSCAAHMMSDVHVTDHTTKFSFWRLRWKSNTASHGPLIGWVKIINPA
jgi:hypothetical protein